MVYTPIPTKATGDTWAHTDHNTYWRDNMAAAVPDIFTTKGDLAGATGADAAARLAAGANNKYLYVDTAQATGMAYKPVGDYLARYKIAAAPVIATATVTIIDFATQVYDPQSDVTTGAAWKYTAPLGGIYLVCASVVCTASANWGENEEAYLVACVDGTEVTKIDYFISQAAAAGGHQVGMSGAAIVQATAAEAINVRIYQTSGANLTITNDPDGCWVSIALLQYTP